MFETSIPDVLRERASLQPNDPAFTFIDYDQDWAGVAETLTWSQLYRRGLRTLHTSSAAFASSGDRALILAPQGLEYIAAFLGALQAGLIAVPLSAPMGGAHDERVDSVLQDTSPSVILTTSPVVGNVAEYAQSRNGDASPSVIEVDSLDLDSRAASDGGEQSARYRLPAIHVGVDSPARRRHDLVRERAGQFPTVDARLLRRSAAPDMTVVSWLPFYHDMGLMLGICKPILGGFHAVLTSPVAFLQRPARWMQLTGEQRSRRHGGTELRFRIGGAENHRRGHGRA